MGSPPAAHDAQGNWAHPATRSDASLIGPTSSHWAIFRELLGECQAAGNLVSNAHLAALAIERGATLCSTDNDFKRFAALQHVNPIADGPTRG